MKKFVSDEVKAQVRDALRAQVNRIVSGIVQKEITKRIQAQVSGSFALEIFGVWFIQVAYSLRSRSPPSSEKTPGSLSRNSLRPRLTSTIRKHQWSLPASTV